MGGQNRSLGGDEAGFGVPLGPHLAPIGAPLGTPGNGRKINNDRHSQAVDDKEAGKTHIREVLEIEARRTVVDRRRTISFFPSCCSPSG